MAIPSTIERVNYGNPSGSVQTGVHRQVIKEAVATRALLAKEAGSLCVFDLAAGTVFTLPAPTEGMEFEFAVTVSNTSNLHKIITNSASVFLVGGVNAESLTAGSADFFVADGTTIVALSMGATTTGGLIGSHVRLRAISSTQWFISGVLCGSGTLATAFATS